MPERSEYFYIVYHDNYYKPKIVSLLIKDVEDLSVFLPSSLHSLHLSFLIIFAFLLSFIFVFVLFRITLIFLSSLYINHFSLVHFSFVHSFSLASCIINFPHSHFVFIKLFYSELRQFVLSSLFNLRISFLHSFSYLFSFLHHRAVFV